MEALSRAGRLLGCMAFGVLAAVVGTVAHRYRFADPRLPIGIVAAVLMVILAAAACRAWVGLAGLGAFGLGWVVVVQLMALRGPGGDLLIASGTIGYVWIYGGLAAIGIVALVPPGWFSDQPVRRKGRRRRTSEADSPAGGDSIGQSGSQV